MYSVFTSGSEKLVVDAADKNQRMGNQDDDTMIPFEKTQR